MQVARLDAPLAAHLEKYDVRFLLFAFRRVVLLPPPSAARGTRPAGGSTAFSLENCRCR